MDFGLTEEQDMLQETVRGLVQNECPTTRLREIFDEGTGFDQKLWSSFSEMGLAGLVVPEAFDGAGMTQLDLALVSEVAGEAALPLPFLGHSLACLGLASAAPDSLKKELLPALASGEQIATIALQEGAAGWEPKAWTAKLDGDRLSGEKTIVMNAANAAGAVVGLQGGEFAWVALDASGVEIQAENGVDRTRPISTLRFDGAPATKLTEADAQMATRLMDTASVMLAADAFGAATKLVDLDVAYSLSREQFGQPIAQFQSIKHQIARLATDLEPTRGLFWYAAHAQDELPDEAAHSASLAKAHITDRAMNTARQSVELHGGYGFTWECEVQMWFKRIMFDRSLFGTPEDHRERCAQLGGW